MENCRLNGVSFVDMPHISRGETVNVVREEGESWDSDALPAYSVRLEGMHIGYIPLVTTIKKEALKAREGFKKKWKEGYENLTPAELRAMSQQLIETGSDEGFYEWEFLGTENTRHIAERKMRECETVEIVRDWIRVEIEYNHLTPTGTVCPMYWDEKEHLNSNEIGEICSIIVGFDTECCSAVNPLGTQTSAAKLALDAAERDA